MNNPEYIVQDEMGTVAADVATVLALPINYQFGYIRELNETLMQWEKDPALFDIKFPLIYLAMPFNISMGDGPGFGRFTDVRLFIMHHTDGVSKAKDRLETNYKPVIYPIYRQLLKSIGYSDAFSYDTDGDPVHRRTDRPYWGEDQQTAITDKVDVLEISGLNLIINNNLNCS